MSGEAASLTGAEHFAKAEKILAFVAESADALMDVVKRNGSKVADFNATQSVLTVMTAKAQVHATLALASATSEITAERRANETKPEPPPAWCENCGTTPRPKCPLCHGGTS